MLISHSIIFLLPIPLVRDSQITDHLMSNAPQPPLMTHRQISRRSHAVVIVCFGGPFNFHFAVFVASFLLYLFFGQKIKLFVSVFLYFLHTASSIDILKEQRTPFSIYRPFHFLEGGALPFSVTSFFFLFQFDTHLLYISYHLPRHLSLRSFKNKNMSEKTPLSCPFNLLSLFLPILSPASSTSSFSPVHFFKRKYPSQHPPSMSPFSF